MKIKITAIVLVFSLFAAVDVKNSFAENYEEDNGMSKFVLNVLKFIKALILKTEKFDAIFIGNDLAVAVYENLEALDNEDREKTEFSRRYIILFDKIMDEDKNKGLEKLALEIISEFLSGRAGNIKAIYFRNKKNSYSWSRETEELKQEKKCGCGCLEGIFSFDLCESETCPLKR